MFLPFELGNSKQKWVPLNIEPPRPPPPRGSYYRNRDGRDHWRSSNNRRDFDKDHNKDVRGGVGRFDRGGMRDRSSHRPWRFDRDNGYNNKYRDKDQQYGRERYDKAENGGYSNKHNGNSSGNGQWNQNNGEDMGWQFNGGEYQTNQLALSFILLLFF